MTDLLSNLQSPAWWFTAVLVALLMNLSAAYVKPGLDRLLQRHWEARRTKSELLRRRHDEFVAGLKANRDEQYRLLLAELRAWTQSVGSFLTATFVLAITLLVQDVSPSVRRVGLFAAAGVLLIAFEHRSRAVTLMRWNSHVPDPLDEFEQNTGKGGGV